MSIKLQLPKLTDLEPRLTVVGVGGAGCNAVNNMIAAGLTGVEYVVANTDAQALVASSAEHRVQLGVNLTEGLGAGAKPEIGQAAAEEAIDDLRAQVSGSHMVFLAAGMGGGTGTGAASVIARAAREQGILVVGVVTKPFQFEGTRRMRIAEAGIEELRQCVDTLIVIPNQNLFRIANEKTTFSEAFVLADHVLYSGVACIVDLILKEGLINLDFADVRSVMAGMGTAMMGTGEASGERRATLAAEEAISNPLLDDISLQGAKGLLLSITGGPDLTLYEVDEAASRVRQEVDSEATIIVGATFDPTLSDKIRVSIVASGMGRKSGNGANGFMGLRQPAGSVSPPSAPQPHATPDRFAASSEHAGGFAASTPPAFEQSGGAPEPSAHNGESDSGGFYDSFSGDVNETADGALQQRLSDAMGDQTDARSTQDPSLAGVWEEDAARPGTHSGAEGGAAYAPRDAQQGFEPLDANETSWQGSGDVLIEEGFAPNIRGADDSSQPVDQFSEASPHNYQFEPAQFDPQQPPPSLRRQERRMPTVEDFPVVGQREYHARMGAAGDRTMGSDAQNGMLQKPQPQQAPRKKGLFERLTGIKRKQSDSFSGAENGSNSDRNYRDDGSVQGRGAPEHGQRRGATNNASGSQEASELPVFFSNRRKG